MNVAQKSITGRKKIMKNKGKLILGIMAAMVFTAIGTISVFAAGKLELANSYSQIEAKVVWNTKEIPEKAYKVEIALDSEANGQSFGQKFVGTQAHSNWIRHTGFEDTVAYELNADGEPTFYPLDLKFAGAKAIIGYGSFIDLPEEYAVTAKVDKIPVKNQQVLIGNKRYKTDMYDYKVEVTINDKADKITGELKWNNVPEADRPEKAVVKVVSGEEEIASQEVNKDGNWKYDIQVPAGLEKYKIVAEIPGFKVVQEGNNLIVSKEQTKPEEKPENKPEVKPGNKPETKPEVKPETKPGNKPEIKPETKPENKPEVKPSEDSKVPKTGDESNVVMWIVIAGLAVAASGVLVKKRVINN